MLRRVIASSSIVSVGYDEQTRTLEIEFQHGGIYQYRAVPPGVYREFIQTPSKGDFFNENIREDYEGVKLESS